MVLCLTQNLQANSHTTVPCIPLASDSDSDYQETTCCHGTQTAHQNSLQVDLILSHLHNLFL